MDKNNALVQIDVSLITDSSFASVMKNGPKGSLITFACDSGEIFFSSPLFKKEMVGERVHLDFLSSGEGPRKYLHCSFYDDQGFLIDGCLPTEGEQTIHLDGTIKEKGSFFGISLSVKNAKAGEKLLLSEFSFSHDTLDPLHGHLGGNKMFMMKRYSFQMESFVFLTNSHKVVVIDGGFIPETDSLFQKIKELGGEVDSWYLSHYHNDHINALIKILTDPQYSSIHIKKLFYDFRVDPKILEAFGDEDNHCVQDLEDALKKSPSMVDQIIIPHKGDINVIDEGLTIEVLNDAVFFSRTNMPNDSSVILKAITKQDNVLFCEDIGDYGDELILDPWFKKEIGDCLFLQTAHHGQNGASESFYQCCHAAKIALFEACYPLFDDNSDGKDPGSGPWSSLKTRGWMRKLGIRYYFLIEEETMFE